jgi:hypothetical protein
MKIPVTNISLHSKDDQFSQSFSKYTGNASTVSWNLAQIELFLNIISTIGESLPSCKNYNLLFSYSGQNSSYFSCFHNVCDMSVPFPWVGHLVRSTSHETLNYTVCSSSSQIKFIYLGTLLSIPPVLLSFLPKCICVHNMSPENGARGKCVALKSVTIQ